MTRPSGRGPGKAPLGWLLAAALLVGAGTAQAQAPAPAPTPAPATDKSVAPQPYTARSYDGLLGTPGLSDTMLRNHFGLYQGYVTNTNKVSESLRQLVAVGNTGPEFAELKRRFGWEWNGVRLHELYFENLGGKGEALPTGGKLHAALVREFGSVEAFQKEFLATGAMRGIGWVVLYQDAAAGRLFVDWIDEHATGHLSGATPLLIMDVFEHAYMTDYGTKKADYLPVFWKNIRWSAVEGRLR